MKILVSNDDGVSAPGLKVLADAMAELGDVLVVAPESNRSGASSSLTLYNPLRINKTSMGYYSVTGTPADCILMGVHQVLDGELPDLVIAGINAGPNLADDVLYSGTVAAAIEGRFLGVPAIAMSIDSREATHLATAGKVAKLMAQKMLNDDLGADKILNINVPNVAMEDLQGFQVTRLGKRHRDNCVVQSEDAMQRPVYWLGPQSPGQDISSGTDFHALERNYVSVTPLDVDMTAYKSFQQVSDWVAELTL
jgi:5'-nucleotidase